MTRALVALLALAAVLAAALWYVTSSGSPGPIDVVEAKPPVASAEQRADANDVTSVATTSAPPSSERAAERTNQREAAPTAHDEELSRAHWVEGRVVFPPSTPTDEELWVAAEGRPFGNGHEHRVKVAGDGSFRVAFSERTKAGTLRLDGRYLYLREKPTWKPDRAEPYLLEPELGGRIVVRVVAPAAAAGEVLQGDVALHLRSDNGSMQTGERALGPELEVAFDALLPERRYVVGFDGADGVGSAEVTTAAGETHEVVLELRPGVALAGRVVDEQGAPLEDVQLQVSAQHGAGGFTVGTWRTATTAADGSFALDALVPGVITLQASLEGYVVAVAELGQLDEGTRRSDVEIVLARGGSLEGVVSWLDGTPAEASLVLEVFDAAGKSRLPWLALQQRHGKSGADGRFRITGLAASAYIVRASATTTERVPVVDDDGHERAKKVEKRWSAELARVETGAQDLVLTLSAGHALAGRVVDDRGVPLGAFSVRAARVPSSAVYMRDGKELAGSYRDTGGVFELDGFGPGQWFVRATADGHAPSDRLRVTVPGARPIELTAPREARVSGRVLGADGEPAADVAIEVERPQQEKSVFDFEMPRRSDARGAFELDRLPPGRTLLTAKDPNGLTSEALELELAPGTTVDDVLLRLRAGATLTGLVVDREGRPEAGVEVRAFSQATQGNRAQTSDADGRFEIRGLSPGAWYLNATNGDGLRLHKAVVLAEGRSAHVELAPPRSATVRLRGRILAAGEPLAAGINAQRSGPPPADQGANVSSSARTDGEGAYEITLPGAGAYRLWISSADAQSFYWSTVIDVPAVAEHTYDVAIPLGRISGRVTRTSGEALPGIWVQAQAGRDEGPAGHGRGQSGSMSETGADGRYELLLPTGTYAVQAGGDRHGYQLDLEFVAAVAKDLRLDAGGHLRGIDFTLASGGALVGDVTASDGIDVSQADIWLDTEERSIRSCEEGSFRLGAVTPGSHRVRATSRNGAATREWTTVEITEGARARVALALEPATMVIARVRDAGGADVACAVEAFDAEERPVTVALGGPGVAYVRWLTRGRYTLRATRGAQVAERTVVVAGTEPKVEVELAFE